MQNRRCHTKLAFCLIVTTVEHKQSLAASETAARPLLKTFSGHLLSVTQTATEIVHNRQVQVFEGSIYDFEVMANCIRETKAVFMVVTANDNIPGCNLSQDSAASVHATDQSATGWAQVP
jgi:hypothetical protein